MKLIPSWTAQFCRNLLTCPDVKDSASLDEALEAIVPAPLPLLSVNFSILKMSSYLIDFEDFSYLHVYSVLLVYKSRLFFWKEKSFLWERKRYFVF